MKKYTFTKGQKWYRLTIENASQEYKKKKNGHKASRPTNIFSCVCECGNKLIVTQEQLYRTRNCGCKPGNTRYGERSQKLYQAWRSMKNRCFWEGLTGFENWGGRGITVCRGLLDFNIFQKVLGEPPTSEHSVDRWPNNDTGNYSCGTCEECIQKEWPLNIRWGTKCEQSSNRRNCYKVEIDGEILSLREACKRKRLPYKQIHERVKRGRWDIQTALNTPINVSNRYKKIKNDKISSV